MCNVLLRVPQGTQKVGVKNFLPPTFKTVVPPLRKRNDVHRFETVDEAACPATNNSFAYRRHLTLTSRYY